jgi:hypothetical protein
MVGVPDQISVGAPAAEADIGVAEASGAGAQADLVSTK